MTAPAGYPVSGIDVSAWQDPAGDAAIMKGLAFAGIRAVYGTERDARYAAHEAAARKAGLVVIAYAFGRNGDGAAQARTMLAAAPRADLYALDLESDGAAPRMTDSQASAFLAAARGLTPRRVGLYHSESGFPAALGQQFNWIAKWGRVPPRTAWSFWQWQGSPLDRDVFNGTIAQLRSMAGLADATVPEAARLAAAIKKNAAYLANKPADTRPYVKAIGDYTDRLAAMAAAKED